MRLNSSAPCVVVLTEKDVEVNINDNTSLILPAKPSKHISLQ
ncbi:Uncharacterised protein [Kluyvera cryocrescens]|uniref:Uncharacterized protein n=1 Tax=Kluyvera cryocrescens TaxID=580 RepID=A0A485CXG9_KLUCR|nr:Uncharacterised protein [Kluyvera cryocrescens]